MTKIKDTFFGGAERRAGRIQAEGIERGQDILREAQARAEGQAIPLFDAAQQNVQTGAQGALDIFGRVAPEQVQAAQAGNLNAQNTQLAGLGQFQNAILGGNVDLSQLQAQQVQAPEAGFFQQQLPQFQGIQETLNPTPEPQVQTGNFLGGLGGMPNLQNPNIGGSGGLGFNQRMNQGMADNITRFLQGRQP